METCTGAGRLVSCSAANTGEACKRPVVLAWLFIFWPEKKSVAQIIEAEEGFLGYPTFFEAFGVQILLEYKLQVLEFCIQAELAFEAFWSARQACGRGCIGILGSVYRRILGE